MFLDVFIPVFKFKLLFYVLLFNDCYSSLETIIRSGDVYVLSLSLSYTLPFQKKTGNFHLSLQTLKKLCDFLLSFHGEKQRHFQFWIYWSSRSPRFSRISTCRGGRHYGRIRLPLGKGRILLDKFLFGCSYAVDCFILVDGSLRQ